MELKMPDTGCEFKTDEHVLKIRRGNSSFDYSWSLYTNPGSSMRGECLVGGGDTSLDGCIQQAAKYGFSIHLYTPIMSFGKPGPKNVTGSGE